MTHLSKLRKAVGTGFSFILLLMAPLVQAQFRASLQGTVTDPSGAVIPGATVKLTNLDTNQVLTSTTTDAGLYNFNALASSHYSLTIERDGFKLKVINSVPLVPEQPNSLNVQLELGGAAETVTVSGDQLPALDTSTASTSGVVSENQIQHLPSFGRDVFQLTQLAPGVFGNGAQGGGGGGQNLPGTQGPGATGGNQGIFQTENGPQALAAGGQYENNSISIDGISTASVVWGGTTIITPSEDSVQNMKIVSNSYDAENGRFSGAQIQVTSKSGTNNVHGSAFYTAHRPGLNAYQRYNGQGNSPLRDNNLFNQWGASVGAPIWKNRIFAFFNYETVRQANSNTVANGWYETSAFASSAPAGSISSTYLNFPGSAVNSTGINNSTCTDAGLAEGVNCNTIPGQGLDIGSPLTTGLGNQDLGWVSTSNPGVGGGLDGVADIANYITSSPSTSSKGAYNGRLDAVLGEKDRISFTLYWVPQSSSFLNGPARQYNYFHHSQINQAFAAIWNHTFSPTFLNEARVNAAGWRWNEVDSNPQSPVGLPKDNIGQIGSLGANGANPISAFGPNVGSIFNQWTYTYKDVATKVWGRNSIKFGGELTRLYYLNECASCGVPNYTFFNLWDFLNDAPSVENGSFDPNTGFPTTFRQDDRQDIWGFFIQDDIKLRPNLTFNVGLRWSYFGPLSSKQGNMYVATPGSGSDYLTGLNVRKGDTWTAQKANFGPQVGFAWSPNAFAGKVVIRGGYGLNYNQEEIAISANVRNNPGLVVQPSFTLSTPTSPNPGIIYATSSDPNSLFGYPANPNTISTFGPNGLPTTGQVNVSIFPTDLPTMLTHHFSFDTQYDLGYQWVATVGYMGSLARNTYFHENPNAVPAASGLTLNPQIGGGDYWGVGGSGNYNALLADLKHQFSHQYTLDAQFTWAKSMDTSSAPYTEQIYPYDRGLNYGRSDYNVGTAFKLFGLWQPVFFHGNKGWLEKVVGGWSLSGIWNWHGGFPWTPVVNVNGGSLYCGTCGYTQLLPAAYLGGAGTDTSNDQFKTGSNYPNGGEAYFSTPTYTAFSGTDYGPALPQSPGVRRNSLTGPGYKDVDMSLTKAFGLPTMPVLGENARIEFRADAYNLFNNLNLKPDSISNNIANANFGAATLALGSRTISLTARFNF